MKLTNRNFFILQLLAHIGLVIVLAVGSANQIASSIIIAAFILMFSSTATYHRFLSHRSWAAPRWWEILGTIIGIFSFTGSSISRTLTHRYHHAYSDTEKDPHSPRILGIFYTYFPMLKERKLNPVLVRDLLNDQFHKNLHEHYLNIILITTILSLIIVGPVWTLSLLVAPGAICWMNIAICNIGCHWGGLEEPIRQNRLLGWITFGEGYHRHHHSNPQDANFGGKHLDLGYVAIQCILFLDKFNKPRTRI
jgi:stearoyl-CoA desaturase (delta-9 desaturase)